MEILSYPDPKLRARNEALGKWSAETEEKVRRMREILSRVRGAGLAAPQVGWNVRLFILQAAGGAAETRERVIWNPVMTPLGNFRLMNEGCLSFAGIFANIPRVDRVRLTGETPDGPIDEILIGFEAHAVQHEMDHLEGVLFIDKMSPAERKLNDPMIKQLEERWRRDHPQG